MILRQGGEPAVIAVVPSIEAAKGFFRESLSLPNGIPARAEKRFAGAASVDLVQSLRLGTLEVIEFKRSADPRPSEFGRLESRMHVPDLQGIVCCRHRRYSRRQLGLRWN